MPGSDWEDLAWRRTVTVQLLGRAVGSSDELQGYNRAETVLMLHFSSKRMEKAAILDFDCKGPVAPQRVVPCWQIVIKQSGAVSMHRLINVSLVWSHCSLQYACILYQVACLETGTTVGA